MMIGATIDEPRERKAAWVDDDDEKVTIFSTPFIMCPYVPVLHCECMRVYVYGVMMI
jgi:hypothetical protein